MVTLLPCLSTQACTLKKQRQRPFKKTGNETKRFDVALARTLLSSMHVSDYLNGTRNNDSIKWFGTKLA